MREIMRNYPVYSEVLYPITWGGNTDYPYDRARHHLRQFCDLLGPDRLVWGSDMPNVERYCTCRQSLSYLEYCDFLGDGERAKILGGNLRTLSL